MDLSSSVLILVDCQWDFLKRENLTPSAGQVINHTALLLQAWRKAGRPVVHLQTRVQRTPDNRMRHWRNEDLWICEAGKPGSEAPESLRATRDETIVFKQGFSSPDLLPAVAKEGSIQCAVIAGVMTHACVRQCALDLYQQDYQVCLAEDAIASDDPVHAAATLRFLEHRAISFWPVRQLIATLGGGKLLDHHTQVQTPAAKLLELTATSCRFFKQTWRDTSFQNRSRMVRTLVGALNDNAELLARMMAAELGKPVRFARMEVLRSGEMIDAIIKRMAEQTADKDHSASKTIKIRRRPLGTVVVITPWNNPVYIALGKIVPAVLAGNAVIWKPAPQAGGVSAKLMQMFNECGWPEPLVQIVEGGARTGRHLLELPGIHGATITASTLAGYSVAEVCQRKHLPFQAELGGNNAALIWHDADLPSAAKKITAGAFEMSGQRCTANRRAIVHASVFDAFIKLLSIHGAGLNWGDPNDESTVIGPMVDEAASERVTAMIHRAVHVDGCTALYPLGQKHSQAEPTWVAPVIIVAEDSGLEIVQEESFGPVLVVQKARDWQHAMTLCNGVRQGLAAALFSSSEELKQSFLNEAQAGILKINASTSDAMVDVPFGGWKASGVGPPEHGDADIEFYTRNQTLYL